MREIKQKTIYRQLYLKLTKNISFCLQYLLLRLRSQRGVETIEYLGLASVSVVLIGAVALFLSGSGQVIIDAIRDIINSMLGGFRRGW